MCLLMRKVISIELEEQEETENLGKQLCSYQTWKFHCSERLKRFTKSESLIQKKSQHMIEKDSTEIFVLTDLQTKNEERNHHKDAHLSKNHVHNIMFQNLMTLVEEVKLQLP